MFHNKAPWWQGKVRHALFGVLTIPGWSSTLSAQALPITVDSSAGGRSPRVDVQGGVPVIQIAPPSGAGVSHNRFTEFNVGTSGVVLNNSRSASQTQLAGQIAGNVMLGHRQATTILNQVTASNPTQLQGMLEVAGQRARVIVANPAGITCNGCGFLNASRATLTTGRPEIGPKGAIAYDVTSGQLQIEGRGLKGTLVDQVDLMARALVVNGEVWANRLNVVAGTARIAANDKPTAIAGQGAAPQFALDSASLGGMYANSIRLVGTEAGVGVNIGGNLVALTGNLMVNAAGDVSVAPNVALSARQHLEIKTPGRLDMHHAALHSTSLNLSARTLHNQAGSITAGGPARIRIQGELDNTKGLIAAAGQHQLDAQQLHNHAGVLAGSHLTIAVKDTVDNRQGGMLADHHLRLSASQLTNSDTIGEKMMPRPSAESPSTLPASLPLGVSGNNVNIRVVRIDNARGTIQAHSDLKLTHDAPWTPHGNLTAGRDMHLATGAALTSTSRLFAARDLRIKSNSFENGATGELLAGRHAIIGVDQAFSNIGLIDARISRITTKTLHNQGRIYGDGVSINAGTIVNDAGAGRPAVIAARGNLDVAASALTNRHHAVLYAKRYLRIGGNLDKAGRATGQADSLHNLSATIEAGKDVSIAAGQIHNRNTDFASEDVRLSSQHKVYYTPEGSTEMYDAATHWLCDAVTPQCGQSPGWLNDDPERRFLLPSRNKYPAKRYGPPFDYAPGGKGRKGISSPIALTHTPRKTHCTTHSCDSVPEQFRYPRDARIWSVFGVSPPVAELPSWPDFQRRSRGRMDQANLRRAYESTQAYKDYKARHMALDARIKSFNRHFLGRLVPHFTFYEVNEIVTRTRTVRSDPGRIFSAGVLNLNGTVINDKSQIAARGKLNVTGPAIHNIGATGRRNVLREGQATFTQARDHDRKAHRAPYHATLAGAPFDLPVGTVQSIWAPGADLPARSDVFQHGTIMAGRSTHLKADAEIVNSGTIGGRERAAMTAKNIVNHSGGQIQACRIGLAAREHITNLAAQIAGDTVALRAGKDINMISTLASEDSVNTRGTHVSGVSQIRANDLTLQAGNDINMLSAHLAVAHNAQLLAGRDVRLGALAATHEETIATRAHQRHELRRVRTVGAIANAKGDMAIEAGQDMSAHAAQIHAQGKLMIDTGRDVVLATALGSGMATDTYRDRKKGIFSSKTTDAVSSGQWEQPHASTVTGQHVKIQAGRDVNVEGSNVGAGQNLDITAAGNVAIAPGRNQASQHHHEKTRKSGAGATGGLSVGKRHKTHAVTATRQGNTPGTLGSLHGNTTIRAGKGLHVTDGRILAPHGNITLTGEQVVIGATHDTHHHQESLEVKQSGLTLRVDVPLLNAMQNLERQVEAADHTDHPLIQGLAAASAGLAVGNAAQSIPAQSSADSAAANNMGNVRVSINVGASRQSTHSLTDATTAVGSTVAAGKNITVQATGKGRDSSLTVDGSNVSAKENLALLAEGDIHLSAAESTTTTQRKHNAAGGSIGVAATVGSNGISFGIEATANGAAGKANGRDTTQTNTHIHAGQHLSVQSGANTYLRGATTRGQHVALDVGGDLLIESLQDTSTHVSKDLNAGGSVVIGFGVSGSATLAQNQVQGDFASAREQSGIQAGDDGFHVQVKGNTRLHGATIASTDAAVQAGLNRLSTGTLITSDIDNYSRYKARGTALGGAHFPRNGDSLAAIAPGLSTAHGHERSTTQSGISGATIHITNPHAQYAQTGKTAEQVLLALNQHPTLGSDANGLTKTWDPEKLRAQVAAEATIIATFTQQAHHAVRTYTEEKRATLRKQIDEQPDEATQKTLRQQLRTLNTQERLANVIIGAATGSITTAALQATLSEAADHMRDYVIADSKQFAGITDGVTTIDNQGGTSAGIRGDGFKAAGVRVVLDVLCGPSNERCKIQKDEHGEKVLDARGIPKLAFNENGMVQFDSERVGVTLAQFLQSPKGQEMSGFTGGVQGLEGTLGGMPYRPDGILDLVHEGFAGPHDFMGGSISDFYDRDGNARRGLSSTTETLYGVWSGVALLPAAPFALSEILPPEAWKAIDILLKLKK